MRAAFPPYATQPFDAFGIDSKAQQSRRMIQEQFMATAKRRKTAQKNARKAQKSRSTARRGGGRKQSPAQRRAQKENLQKGRKRKGTIRKLLGL